MFQNFLNFFKTLNFFSVFSTDTYIIIGIFLFFFLYGFVLNKSRLVSLLLSFYPALFLFKIFPFLDKLVFLHGDKLILVNKIGLFILFLILFDIIIAKFISSDSAGGSTHFFHIAFLALGLTALVLVFSYTVVSFDIFYDFSPAIDTLFASTTKVFFWMLAPLFALFFV